ncbi:MAG: mechanosensitive ion channel family protein [Fimbriimonadaceae bacterium]|nr:mechanosensitive ion channel family protein [Fimbriimonadaceae bacterium]
MSPSKTASGYHEAVNSSAWKWLATDPYGRLALLGIVLVLVVIAVRALQAVANRRILDRDARYRTRKLISGLGYFSLAAAALAIFGPKMSDVAVAAGIASAGLAFALQEVIASIAGYVAVSFGGFYRIGDRVQLGGIRGDVIDISVLRTTLMELGEWVEGDLYNGRIVRVANSFVFKEPVFNYSGDFPFVWDEIKIPVRFGSDAKLARQIFQSVADEVCQEYLEPSLSKWHEVQRKYSVEDARLEPAVTLKVTDNWIEYTARYVVPFDRRRTVRDRLHTAILEEVNASNGRVQLGSTTIEIVAFPETGSRSTST